MAPDKSCSAVMFMGAISYFMGNVSNRRDVVGVWGSSCWNQGVLVLNTYEGLVLHVFIGA